MPLGSKRVNHVELNVYRKQIYATVLDELGKVVKKVKFEF